MKTGRFLIVLALGFGLLAACQPISVDTLAVTGGENVLAKESLDSLPVAPERVQGAHSSYSGDDAYDPAAGGLSPDQRPSDLVMENPVRKSGGYSGDDAYDPAAGGLSPDQRPSDLVMENPIRKSGDYRLRRR